MLKWNPFGMMNLQLFAAEGGGDGGSGGEGGSGGDGGAGGSGGGAPPPAGKTYSEDYVKDLREENASHRTRARGLETAVRGALGLQEGAGLPDDLGGALGALKNQGQDRITQTETKAKAALLKAAFIAAAAGKVADADDAFALAGQELADVEVDLDKGAVTVKQAADGKDRTMTDLVDAFLTRKPHLKAGGQAGGAGGTTPPGGGGGGETPQQAAERIAKERATAKGSGTFDLWKRP